jgi:hypothetical protein
MRLRRPYGNAQVKGGSRSLAACRLDDGRRTSPATAMAGGRTELWPTQIAELSHPIQGGSAPCHRNLKPIGPSK